MVKLVEIPSELLELDVKDLADATAGLQRRDDPESPEPANLEAAIRLARLLALASLVEHEVDVDAAAIRAALTGIREQLDAVRSLKGQLTSISNATKAVWTGLEQMRSNILARVIEADTEIGT